MALENSIKEFLKILEVKTEEGINKLINLCIGTKEYEMMVQHIVSNINLLKEEQHHGSTPRDGDPDFIQKLIGKEFQ